MFRIEAGQLDEIDRRHRRRRVERLAEALQATDPEAGSLLERPALLRYLLIVMTDGRSLGFVTDYDLVGCAAVSLHAQRSPRVDCVAQVRRVLQDRDVRPAERLAFIRRHLLDAPDERAVNHASPGPASARPRPSRDVIG